MPRLALLAAVVDQAAFMSMAGAALCCCAPHRPARERRRQLVRFYLTPYAAMTTQKRHERLRGIIMVHRITTSMAVVSLVGALALVSGVALADKTTTVKLADSQAYGKYLVNGLNYSLYLFESDSNGKSSCYDDCAQVWPPFVVQGELVAGQGINADRLGSLERENGLQQATYYGNPLYVYVKDTDLGETAGQDIEDYGGRWHLVTAEGEKAKP